MASHSGHYIHGSDTDEQRRLSRLNDLLNATSVRALGLSGGERVLDVGSGLGQLSLAMARAVAPDGHVIGVDRDAAQLEEARRQPGLEGAELPVEFRLGDATTLPLDDEEWGTLDVAHARFVLEHVADPLAVVRAMVRAVRPGGRIVLEDDDHDLLRLWPEVPEFQGRWRAYAETYSKLGNADSQAARLSRPICLAGASALALMMCLRGRSDRSALVMMSPPSSFGVTYARELRF